MTGLVLCVINWLFLPIKDLNVNYNYNAEDGIIQVVSQ